MDVDFKKKIEKELIKLDNKSLALFVWRIAVRTLPLIGRYGSFSSGIDWRLYSYFHGLDIILDIDKSEEFDWLTLSNSGDLGARDGSYITFNVSRKILEAIRCKNADDAATLADNFVKYIIGGDSKQNIQLELLREAKGIFTNEKVPHVSTQMYGTIWDKFIAALETENCGYWGQLYKKIFDSNLEVDNDALKRRLSVPKEIRKQGASKVAYYLEELEKGATHLNEARIIILGEKGSGKTSIARKLINPKAEMPKASESTAGVDTMLWKLEEENINVRIWDFAGHTITHAVHQFFLSERCLYLLVYDGRREDRNILEYWLDYMKNFGGDSKAIILVNKRDQHSVNIRINELKEKYPIEKVFTFSIKDDNKKLEEFRIHLANYIKNNPAWKKQEIPESYYLVKEEIETLFINSEKGTCVEFITKEKYNDITAKHYIDNPDELLNDLHVLGVSLWYKDIERFNTLILNPEWISNGIYQILNWANQKNQYSLSLFDFSLVFSENSVRYPIDKHEFLFDLMVQYELAFRTDNGKSLIIPHLLKEDRPKELPEFPVGESLMLRYKADQPLPPNTISRFIVRHKNEIAKKNDNYSLWRYGVVLEDDKGSIALVREKNRAISVAVKGMDKTNFIDLLRETLNDIFNSYQSDKPDLQYRLDRFGQISAEFEEQNPLWLSDRKIISQSEDNIPYYEDTTRQYIDLQHTVKQYNITAQNLMLEGQHNQLIGRDSIKHIFNFKNCNIGLQGNLNELAQLLSEEGNKEEAKELENIALVLEQTEQCKTKEEIKKKGIANRLKRLVTDLGDKNSKLYRTVEGIKNGISIAKEISKGIYDIIQWVEFP